MPRLAPDFILISCVVDQLPLLPTSSPISTQHKGPQTLTPKTVKAKIALSVNGLGTLAHHPEQPLASISCHPTSIVSNATARILGMTAMTALTHALAAGAGPPTTLTTNAPHPTLHAVPPTAWSPSITGPSGLYAPPPWLLMMTLMSHAVQQEIMMVTWKVSPPTSHMEVPL
jgi:hypothetical protein